MQRFLLRRLSYGIAFVAGVFVYELFRGTPWGRGSGGRGVFSYPAGGVCDCLDPVTRARAMERLQELERLQERSDCKDGPDSHGLPVAGDWYRAVCPLSSGGAAGRDSRRSRKPASAALGDCERRGDCRLLLRAEVAFLRRAATEDRVDIRLFPASGITCERSGFSDLGSTGSATSGETQARRTAVASHSGRSCSVGPGAGHEEVGLLQAGHVAFRGL